MSEPKFGDLALVFGIAVAWHGMELVAADQGLTLVAADQRGAALLS